MGKGPSGFSRCIALTAAVCLSACSSVRAPSTTSASAVGEPRSQWKADANMPLATPDPAARCVRAATNQNVANEETYAECLAGSRALQQSQKPHPSRDEDAITAAILQVYAAYALDRTQAKRFPPLQARSARVSLPKARELIADARRQLTYLAVNGVSRAVRERAYSVRACLIDRDGPCLDEWARAQ